MSKENAATSFTRPDIPLAHGIVWSSSNRPWCSCAV